MKLTPKLQIALFVGLISSCGRQAAEDKQQQQNEASKEIPGQTVSAADLVQDSEVSGDIISSQVDDAISALSDQDEQPESLSLALAAVLTGERKLISRTQTCSEDEAAGTATVQISAEHSGENKLEVGNISRSNSWSREFAKTKVWSKDGGAIACNDNGMTADVPLADMSGVSLKVDFKGMRKHSIVRTNKRNNVEISRIVEFSISGSRDMKVDKAELGDDNLYSVEKTIATKVDRQVSITRRDGSAQQLQFGAETSENAPLKILVERDGTSLELKARTVKSGTIVTKFKDGGSLEASFDNVRYENRDSKLICGAVSGVVTGKITDANGTVSSTFEIDFSKDAAVISHSDGSTTELDNSDCEIDKG